MGSKRYPEEFKTTRDDAINGIFDYIEMFYNSKRRHSFNDQLSPVKHEERYEKRLKRV